MGIHDAIDLGLAAILPSRTRPRTGAALDTVDPSNPGLYALFAGGVLLMGVSGYLFYWNDKQKKISSTGAEAAKRREAYWEPLSPADQKRLAAGGYLYHGQVLPPHESYLPATRCKAEKGEVTAHYAQATYPQRSPGWILPTDDADVKFLQRARRILADKGQSTAQFDEAISAQRQGKNAVGWNLPWPVEVWK